MFLEKQLVLIKDSKFSTDFIFRKEINNNINF